MTILQYGQTKEGKVFILKIADKIRGRQDISRALDLKDNLPVYLILLAVWLFAIYINYRLVERKLMVDLLFMPVEKVSKVTGSKIKYPVKTDIYDWHYAGEYQIEVMDEKGKTLNLYVNKDIKAMPKGTLYNIFYLKNSRLIVDIEVLESKKKDEIEKEMNLNLCPAQIPKYTKDELKELTKTHRLPVMAMFVYCIIGMAAIVTWGIYSYQEYFYWYVLETHRCAAIWILFAGMETAFILMFRKLDRGYIKDMRHTEICVTEGILAENIYGRKFIYRVDRRFKDKIRAVEFEVIKGKSKNERFLMYTQVSEYWNCLPMCTRLPAKFTGRFEKGDCKINAVRLYYLKNSKIVVKVDADVKE